MVSKRIVEILLFPLVMFSNFNGMDRRENLRQKKYQLVKSSTIFYSRCEIIVDFNQYAEIIFGVGLCLRSEVQIV